MRRDSAQPPAARASRAASRRPGSTRVRNPTCPAFTPSTGQVGLEGDPDRLEHGAVAAHRHHHVGLQRAAAAPAPPCPAPAGRRRAAPTPRCRAGAARATRSAARAAALSRSGCTTSASLTASPPRRATAAARRRRPPQHGVEEELPVAGGPGDGRERGPGAPPARRPRRPRPPPCRAARCSAGSVTSPPRRDLPAAHFELRLHQHNVLRAGPRRKPPGWGPAGAAR